MLLFKLALGFCPHMARGKILNKSKTSREVSSQECPVCLFYMDPDQSLCLICAHPLTLNVCTNFCLLTPNFIDLLVVFLILFGHLAPT